MRYSLSIPTFISDIRMSFAYWRRYILLKIGIECESIEGPESWGVGRIVKKLLEEISHRPELAQEFKFFLYFKSKIPDYQWLDNPIFIKKLVLKHSNILQNVGINFFSGSFSLYYYICLPIKLWFEKLDLVFFPNYMLPILFRGRSLVILTEDIYYEINSGTLPWRYKLAYKIFAGWWATRHATKIMAISETSKNEVARLFKIDPERIVANQLGVDAPKKIPNSRFQIPNSYILYVGQAFPRRHLRETMLAFEKLVSDTTHYPLPTTHLQLIAVGKDKYNPPIIKKLAEDINRRLGRERIIYKEYVSEEELVTLYANAKCLVYVSSREAFGLPPLEALSYRVPAVVADQPITREIFGDNAFFVPVSNSLGSSTSKYLEVELPSRTSDTTFSVETIASAIKKALTDEAKRQEIITNANLILQKYTWQGFADRFLQILQTVSK